jgi:hypothetical protein
MVATLLLFATGAKNGGAIICGESFYFVFFFKLPNILNYFDV